MEKHINAKFLKQLFHIIGAKMSNLTYFTLKANFVSFLLDRQGFTHLQAQFFLLIPDLYKSHESMANQDLSKSFFDLFLRNKSNKKFAIT
ncbi:hypothetical protein BpHYR1_015562 [Brachionus plicatilis]|uniref:Uncharacterized protein n=1 Tax=Brachionus plicatilis TaxID=10195 RepID=A0A3M7S594_BRAPC|nr:hypothetical protein BpHYR1_015562 [Brachionus plicatilis]